MCAKQASLYYACCILYRSTPFVVTPCRSHQRFPFERNGSVSEAARADMALRKVSDVWFGPEILERSAMQTRTSMRSSFVYGQDVGKCWVTSSRTAWVMQAKCQDLYRLACICGEMRPLNKRNYKPALAKAALFCRGFARGISTTSKTIKDVTRSIFRTLFCNACYIVSKCD